MEEQIQEISITPLDDWDDIHIEPKSEAQPEVKENLNAEAKPEEKNEQSEEKTEEEIKLFKAKVDGKEVEVSIDDLLNNYSGKVAWDKRFTELDKERKAFLREKEQINSTVNKFRELSNTKGDIAALSYLAEVTGKAPHEYVESVINSLLPEINRRSALSQEEILLEKQQLNNKYTQEKLAQERQSIEQQKAEQALTHQIESIIASKNISNEEWDAVVAELDAKLPKDQNIYPETVRDYIDFKRGLVADKNLAIFNGGMLASNQLVRDELINIINEQPYLSDQDIQDILSEAFNIKQEAELKEKIVTKTTKQTKSQEVEIKPLEHWEDF